MSHGHCGKIHARAWISHACCERTDVCRWRIPAWRATTPAWRRTRAPFISRFPASSPIFISASSLLRCGRIPTYFLGRTACQRMAHPPTSAAMAACPPPMAATLTTKAQWTGVAQGSIADRAPPIPQLLERATGVRGFLATGAPQVTETATAPPSASAQAGPAVVQLPSRHVQAQAAPRQAVAVREVVGPAAAARAAELEHGCTVPRLGREALRSGPRPGQLRPVGRQRADCGRATSRRRRLWPLRSGRRAGVAARPGATALAPCLARPRAGPRSQVTRHCRTRATTVLGGGRMRLPNSTSVSAGSPHSVVDPWLAGPLPVAPEGPALTFLRGFHRALTSARPHRGRRMAWSSRGGSFTESPEAAAEADGAAPLRSGWAGVRSSVRSGARTTNRERRNRRGGSRWADKGEVVPTMAIRPAPCRERLDP
mmetsp:Transcript_130174/g.290993  ORF Transcript_130174/g.290993 Transcript_130174/m.290993 type:complete len:428 (+) Transcript_130174:1325-2608(+)